jgi:hypothetical protein
MHYAAIKIFQSKQRKEIKDQEKKSNWKMDNEDVEAKPRF